MNILFITSTHLGDAILSTGLLCTLMEKYPFGEITVVCGAVPAPLFQEAPAVKRVIILNKKPLSGHWFAVWKQVVKTRWEVIVDLRGTLLCAFLRSRLKYVFSAPRNLHGRRMPKVDQLASLLGLSKAPWNRLWCTAIQDQEAGGYLPEGPFYVALSPTANWPPKSWPLDSFVELMWRLVQDKILPNPRFLILGSRSQRPEVDFLFEKGPRDHLIDLMGKPSLPVLAACMKRIHLFVGNDSGLMHMAATMGVETIGLFGPSSAEVYRPWGPRVSWLEVPGTYEEAFKGACRGEVVLDKIKPAEVADHIYQRLSKSSF